MAHVALVLMLAVLGTAVAASAAPGNPFGAGEPACIQPDAETTKGANAMMTAYAKAVACVAKCHVQRAKEKLADGTALQACEDACRVKYDAAAAKVAGKVPTYDVQPNFALAEASVDTAPIHHCADSEGPTVTNLVCTPNPVEPGSGSCSFTVVDASPIASTACTFDGSPVDCSNGTFTFREGEPGLHYILIVAYDSFANPGPPNPQFTMNVSIGDRGHVVLIGHDYDDIDPATTKILGNTVKLSAAHDFVRPIKVASFTGGASAEEVVNVRTALLQELGPDVQFGPEFSDATSEGLREHLFGHDVLLIYDQNDTGADLVKVGESWFSGLRDFLNAGGVVIVLDGLAEGSIAPSDTCELLEGAQLLDCGAPVDHTGLPVVDRGSGHPIANGVGNYTGPVNTVHFSPGDPLATNVFADGSSGAYHPVVMHKWFP